MVHQFQILLHKLSYLLADGRVIFNGLDLALSNKRVGLVGQNGSGKSTLLRLITNELQPSAGHIQISGSVAYLSQIPDVAATKTVAQVLGFAEKISALQAILAGSVSQDDYATLNEDWQIGRRVHEILQSFGLDTISYEQPVSTLSGGELTRLLLTKIFYSTANFLLLDEPTNHLDSSARNQLYRQIKERESGMLIVSHDRALLNLMDEIIEISSLGVSCYGGNYDQYLQQKEIERAARIQDVQDAEKLMHKTKKSIQLSKEKHQQKQATGRALRRSGSIDKLSANAAKGRSERSQSKMLIKEERMKKLTDSKVQTAKSGIEINHRINVNLNATTVPNGKMVIEIKKLYYSHCDHQDLIENFSLTMMGPERIALIGDNGSGKTTLVQLILSKLQPDQGSIQVGVTYVSYLDQQARLLDPELSILENFLILNEDSTQHDAYQHLASFLFKNVAANKLVKNLSGGEKLRGLLACVLMSKQPPQLLILDEPTNHLDIYSIESIESALSHYQGAMIVISHDHKFLENIGITRIFTAPFKS